MKMYRSLTELIGHTPLLALTGYCRENGLNATIAAKLEAFNPAGSVKDRTACAMLDAAEASGALKPGGTIIEPTSGNTGIGLAWVAAARGYRTLIVMPDSMSPERRALIRAYGAELVLTDGALGMKGAIARAQELHEQIAGSLIPDQFSNPANPAVRQYIADGVAELCENYDLDGIHFDDYFYPTTDPDFDAADYAAYCAGTPDPLPLDDWRRRNVDALVTLCRETAQGYGVRFGIAPQGDPALNYSAQYSDAARWLAEGMVDYLMPQLYWGLDYTQNGAGSHALGALAARWLAMERAPGTALYFGLGAYRIGEGDGGDRSGPGSEWQTGRAMAAQAAALADLGGEGVGLYRYDSLFANTLWPTLAAQERAALQALFAGQTPAGEY